ncbi:inorganic phosphate transporter [uncultured Bacteroides sp.]|uniref:inorganic phosphate transporter n=1 Tax=uncultured Bacteroides sp. TaxID=162156 RepID=UPI002AA6B43E|nr:inorganic phosphate transporter [uncultured Bacteroides sp.]
MTLLIIVIALGFIFDFINGFHDAANSIATVVTTRVLTPFQAVLWAAAFNFIAFFVAKYVFGEFGIANTVSKVVLEQYITLPIIFSGLVAAISWNLLTWRLGIPSSSSHTLIGGFAGAAICGGGFQSIHTAVIVKIAAFIVLAPVIGMVISSMITIGVLWLFKGMNARTAENSFRKLQLVSSGLFSLGHGLNDSQKVMGIIATALISYGSIDSVQSMPDWVPLCCFAAIGLGTMSGGWRIVKTMGSKITKVTALEGVCAESAGAVTLFITEILKIPVSTTHTITGSIMGVGAVKRLSAVRWGVTINLMWAWILTIPVSAVLASLIYLLVSFIGIK